MKKPILDRLSKHVKDDKTGCWNWTGSKDKDGYGRMISGEKGRRVFSFAHRESYKFYKGEIGAPGGSQGCVLHTCDNPSCINPEHLYLGDQEQNGLDKKVRGRARTAPQYGEANGMYGKKHTPETLKKISKGVRLAYALRVCSSL